MHKTRTFLIFMASSVFLAFLFVSLIPTPGSRAQFGGVVSVISDIPTFLQTNYQKVTNLIDKANQKVGYNIITGTIQTFLNQIAYESATFIAQGDTGGKSLIRTKSFNRVLQDASDAAVGNLIQRVSDVTLQEAGINICEPSVEVKAKITLGIIDSVAPPAPKCDIKEVQKRWTQFGKSISSGEWLSEVTLGLTENQKTSAIGSLFGEQNDLLGFLGVSTKLQAEIQRANEVIKISASECQGYKDKKAPISDDIIVHCQTVHKIDIEAPRLAAQEAELLKSESVFGQAVQLFGRTLSAKLLKKWIGGGYSLANLNSSDTSGNLRDSLINRLRSRVDLRRGGGSVDVLADLKTVTVNRIDNYQYLDELVLCPPDKRLATPNNCTMDSAFAAAVNKRQTIAQALAAGNLDANLPLISYLNKASNGDKNCFQKGYCYSNLARLRKYRIVPLGLEIAAALSPVDRPITLGQAVGCFDNSNCFLEPAQNVYYHLVDPNWVLTAPLAQCQAYVYGQLLENPNSNERQQICVDHPTCLQQDAKGNCLSGYGYCTREENIWRFAGDQCLEQYASCEVYTRKDNGARYTYLKNTVENCDASQAGCQWYSKSVTNIGTAAAPIYDWNANDKIYFNNKVKSCPADAVGCHEFVVPNRSSVNLVTNGNFTQYKANSATDYSQADWGDDNLTDSFDGWIANGANFETYTTVANSYFGGQGIRLQGDGQLSSTALAGALAGKTFTLSWFAKADTSCSATASIGSLSTSAVSANVDYSSDWKRYQLTQTFEGDNADQIATIFLGSSASCGKLYVDGVKFEVGSSASNFSEYGDGGEVHLSGKRVSCQQAEVGCQLFTPQNGDAAVPGIVNPADRCPAECVGYNSFLELPAQFDTLENSSASAQSYNLIPASARKCPATQVGCSEFTNLDEVAQGGEGKYYFTYIRQCVEASRGVTYYTLEGSETSGYQVRTWQILPSDITDADGSQAPCTNIAIGGSTCTDSAPQALDDSLCTAADLASNPNCREFFDINGLPHYRLQDQVIFASNDCHPYRRTESGAVYNGLASASRSCSAQNVQCREYRGNQGNNIRSVFNDTFESQSVSPWKNVTINPVYSTESTNQGGHSMGFAAGTVGRPVNGQIVAGREYYLSFWAKNISANTEIRAFLGKLNGSQTECNSGVCEFTATTITTPTDWQVYNVGPLYLDKVLTPDNVELDLVSSANVFIDNVTLKESTGNSYLIRNSWSTPASCDQPFAGAQLGCQLYRASDNQTYYLHSFSQLCRQEAVGCQAVIDTQNSDSPFSQVYHQGDPSEVTVPADNLAYVVVDPSKYCAASYQGCSLLGSPTLNRDLPEQDPRYVAGFNDVTLINDPDQYNSTLCLDSGLFCQEYSDSAGKPAYFQDPRNRTCTYGEGVSINGVLYNGWFQTDTLEPGQTPRGCYSDGIPPFDSKDFSIYKSVDSEYTGWVGTCPANQNQCSEFVDVQATVGENRLVNPDFKDGTSGWATWSAYGNTLNDTTNPKVFTVNTPQPGTAIVKTKATGTGLFFQRVFAALNPEAIKNSDVYSLSADVKIDQFYADDRNGGGIEATMRCNWDSPYDTDYCATVNPANQSVTINYNQACTTNANCPGSSFCYKLSRGYCDSATDRTQIPCENNSQCDTANGYSCNLKAGYESTDSLGRRRDHTAEFTAGADIKKIGQTQNLNVVADIGSKSQGDELVYCEPTFRIYSGYYVGTNPGCDVNNSDYDPDCHNTACTNSGASCSPTNSSCGAGSCGGESAVEFSNVSLRKAKSYFYLDNQSIDDQSCNGLVSLGSGCVLFNDADNPTKLYNTFWTYLKSQESEGRAVSPVSCDPNSADPRYQNCTNDANRIIKVDRDRQCSEWLSCRSSSQVFDQNTKSYRSICSEVGLCSKYSSNADLLHCAQWEEGDTRKLDYAVYTGRDVRFSGQDYSGFSIYNEYPADDLKLVDVSIKDNAGPDAQNPDFRLSWVTECNPTIDAACADPNGNGTQYGTLPCGPTGTNNSKLGRVFGPVVNGSGICVLGIDGSVFDTRSPYVVPATIRGYAEANAPFPQSLVNSSGETERKIKSGFQNATICDSTVASCETGYYKLQYGPVGGTTRYFSILGELGGNEVPTCICEGGDNDGRSCSFSDLDADGTISADEKCPGGGGPAQLRRSETYLNWPGYCLEPDYGTTINGSENEYACNTWLPVDTAPGGIDYFNQNREAGYNFKAPSYQCAAMKIIEERTVVRSSKMERSELSQRYELFNKDESSAGEMKGSYRFMGDSYIALTESGKWNTDDTAIYVFYPTAQKFENGNLVESKCLGAPHLLFGGRKFQIPNTNTSYTVTDFCTGSYDNNTFYARCTDSDKDCQNVQDVVMRGETWPYAVCIELAQTVDERGNNAAKTNLFWSDYVLASGYSIQISPSQYIKLDSDEQPYGSAVPASGFRPRDFPVLYVQNKGEVPRAGSPYACANDSTICRLLGDSNGDKIRGLYISQYKNKSWLGNETYAIGVQRIAEVYKKIYGIYKYVPGSQCGYACDAGTFGGDFCDDGSKTCALDTTRNFCSDLGGKCINSLQPSSVSCNPSAGCPTGFIMNSSGACVTSSSFGQLGCLAACTPYTNQGWQCRQCNDSEDCNAITSPDCTGVNCRCVSQTTCPVGFRINAQGHCIADSGPVGSLACATSCTPYNSLKYTCRECADPETCTSISPTCSTGNCLCTGPKLTEPSPSACSVSTSGLGCRLYTGFDKVGSNDKRCWGSFIGFLPAGCSTDFDCQDTSDTSNVSYDSSRGIFRGPGVVTFMNDRAYCAPSGTKLCTGVDFSTGKVSSIFLDDRFVDCSTTITNALGQQVTAGDEICRSGGQCRPSTEVVTVNGPLCSESLTVYHKLCDPDTDPNCVPNCVAGTPGCSSDRVVEGALPLDRRMTKQVAQGISAGLLPATSTQLAVIAGRNANLYSGVLSPLLAAAFCDPTSSTCRAGQPDTFTINGNANGYIGDGQKDNILAVLGFHAAAHKDQMPLRHIEIDWGDGSDQALTGYYKNALPVCDPKATTTIASWGTLDFAGSARACQPGVRTYFHLYSYNPAYDGKYGCPAGTACYWPRVMLQDNWGWCTRGLWGEVGAGCGDSAFVGYGGGNTPGTNLIRVKKPE